ENSFISASTPEERERVARRPLTRSWARLRTGSRRVSGRRAASTRGGTQMGSGVRQAASIAWRSSLRGAGGRAAVAGVPVERALGGMFGVTAGHSWAGGARLSGGRFASGYGGGGRSAGMAEFFAKNRS